MGLKKNIEIEFAWKIMADNSDEENPIYAYRNESWVYIIFCILLHKPLPAIRITGDRNSFQKAVKRKEEQNIKIGLVSALVQLLVFFIYRIEDYYYIFWMSIFSFYFVYLMPYLTIGCYERLNHLSRKIFKI